jgi:hypothetical protein
MAAHEDVEQDQATGDQGDADGQIGGNHEPSQVHASIFNQIWLNSQHPQQHPLIRGLRGDKLRQMVPAQGVRVQWIERESIVLPTIRSYHASVNCDTWWAAVDSKQSLRNWHSSLTNRAVDRETTSNDSPTVRSVCVLSAYWFAKLTSTVAFPRDASLPHWDHQHRRQPRRRNLGPGAAYPAASVVGSSHGRARRRRPESSPIPAADR